MKKILIISAFTSAFLVCLFAEVHYQDSITDVKMNSDLTDLGIVQKMNEHGFNISDPNEKISFVDKIKALF